MQRLPDQDYLVIPRRPRRDRYQRPLVWLPGYEPIGNPDIDEQEKRAYTRCTKYIDVLDDGYQLTLWKMRQVLRGSVLRPDLHLEAASHGQQPDKVEEYDQYREWRNDYDRINRDLMKAAASDAKANIGTALHRFVERLDRGLEVKPAEVPDRYHQHLRNYMHVTRKLTAVEVERFMLEDGLRVGGTPDRILLDERNRFVIGDVKTGNVDFDPEKIGRQLAIYSRSRFYDDATGQRSRPLEIDQEWGVIIKLDARTGVCELIDVNLTEGWAGVLTCERVRSERNRKVTTRPHIDPDAPAIGEEVTPETLAAIRQAVGAAANKEALDAIWQAAHHVWTDDLTEAAKERLGELTLAQAGPALTGV